MSASSEEIRKIVEYGFLVIILIAACLLVPVITASVEWRYGGEYISYWVPSYGWIILLIVTSASTYYVFKVGKARLLLIYVVGLMVLFGIVYGIAYAIGSMKTYRGLCYGVAVLNETTPYTLGVIIFGIVVGAVGGVIKARRTKT